MKPFILFFIFISMGFHCSPQPTNHNREKNAEELTVGGSCEGCEAIYESTVPFKQLKPYDTLPDFYDAGPRLMVSGTIYKADGHTPAGNVVMYIYHTDQQGIYPRRGNEKGWAKRHGFIQGWIKTGPDGGYSFYTLVPASYPNSNNPKHIHPVIKEEGMTAYWIDEYLFEDDPYLSKEMINTHSNRGGNGVLKLHRKNGMLHAKRDIILGLNIPGYPAD